MRFLRLMLAATALLAFTASATSRAAEIRDGAGYQTLAQPVRADTGKKVEVIEFFAYHCPACNALDPTFNQFPADPTHVRLARGGLDKQTAILPLIGRASSPERRSLTLGIGSAIGSACCFAADFEPSIDFDLRSDSVAPRRVFGISRSCWPT